jgi:hypothetical protein
MIEMRVKYIWENERNFSYAGGRFSLIFSSIFLAPKNMRKT